MKGSPVSWLRDRPAFDRITASGRAGVEWLAHSPRRAFILIFLLSFLLRSLLLFWRIPLAHIRPEAVSEVGRVARSLALRGEYANPYILPTGSTAHTLPVYTGLLALIYRLFGYTTTAGYVRSLWHIAGYSLMYALIPWFGVKFGLGRPAGVMGGLGGALILQRPLREIIQWSWGEQEAGIALGLLLAVCLARWSKPHSSHWSSLFLGLGFGFAFHLAPALLLVMLGCLAFELAWLRNPRRRAGAAFVVLGAALACAPWAWRNYTTFHAWFFIRDNFGLELRFGNHPGAGADIGLTVAREDVSHHPADSPAEALEVRRLGETAYMRQAQQEALVWIQSHPLEFLRLTATRAFYFWFGPWRLPRHALGFTLLALLALLGARRALPQMTTPQRAALLIPLAVFPLVYYVVNYMPRYSVPLNWMLLMLSGAALWSWLGAGKPGRGTETGG